MPGPPKLNYAPPSPMHRRESFRRWIYLTVALAILIAGRWWIPRAWRRAELMYWQHRCMVYSPPKDQVVFKGQIGFDRSLVSAQYSEVIPYAWSHFYNLASPPGLISNGTIFLHALRNKRGIRLVSLDVGELPDGTYDALARVFYPGTSRHAPAQCSGYSHVYLASDKERLLVFAGHADPMDVCHFTFRIVTGTKQQIFDGWLQNDDTVSIGERSVPVTQP
jgi:hypothetical protein